MPRATHLGQSALRNRNRVTNKTRLKVIKDSIEADPIVLDEDEEKARVVSTAGVDAEDANEHHLQAVLNAAASRHQAARTTRAAEKESPPTAFIPTPDSTGVVQNYDQLYPSGRWKDPFSYVKSSDTIEEATSYALANGFIYYMDERDKDWLDKNNEEARGEGTSAQGALSGASTRSGRSAKSKGKEPDVVQCVAMSEDEFELVMCIFEKVTHEKTEFLHHGVEQGAPFPPFSDYQDTFASPLKPELLAVYHVPDWVPHPQHLLRLARVIYPYWRERRLERGGHRIIPSVLLDETDTKNESYICFRRREIKAVRKTRASQASYSDRMLRLQGELGTTLDLVRLVHQREQLKRESQSQNHYLWDKRHVLADLKRARPSLGSKEDEELYLDRERPPKKPKVEQSRTSLRLPPKLPGEMGSPITHTEPQVRPREREATIRRKIDEELLKRKDADKQWEDASDFPYQASPVPFGARQFKYFGRSPSASSSAASALSDEEPEQHRAVRLRRGRGGRFLIDRHVNVKLRPASFGEDEEDMDRLKRLEERYRYDDDDAPAVGAGGPDEQDRKLIDACQPRHIAIHMSLFNEADHKLFLTDSSLHVTSAEGRQSVVWPFQAAQPCHIPVMRTPMPTTQRTPSAPPIPSITNTHASSNSVNGTPISVPTRASSLAHLRISSGGGVRVVSGSTPNGAQHSGSPHSTPPSSASVNGFADAQAGVGDGPEQKPKLPSQSSPNGVVAHPDAAAASITSSTPAPAKALASTVAVNIPNMPNGYSMPAVNGYQVMPKAPYMHSNARHNGQVLQQMQSITALLPDSNNVNISLRQPGPFMMPNGAYPMQMAGARPMQWPVAGQRSPHTVGVEGVSGVDGTGAQMGAGSPGRAPSANGVRTPQIARSVAMAGANHALGGSQGRASPAGIARLTPHSPSPHILSPNMAAAQANVHSSPTRAPQPAIPTPSPSLQTRQVVGGSGAAGY
ncbi:Enhancer of polycomb-like protein 1 [Trametes pubescens]|uniref:Enhancer of polycomb-like protein n=1 Tax=Trametes pubescens TaxID=154538 RepID=A0A1M2V2F4_TRAPU|nr:Enhancer of polycomb-like protein 1 [Trametes pubescens]